MTIQRLYIASIIFIALTAALSTSCVGKKKFISEVSSRDSVLAHLSGRIISLNQQIATLELQVAEKNGENNVLKSLQEKQEGKIKRLEKDIENITNKSLSQQQLMDLALQEKAVEVKEKEQVIERLQNAIDQQRQSMQDLLGKIQSALQQYNQSELSLEVKEGKVYVGLSEKLLFKSGSADLSKEAMGILGKIAEVLNKHPELDIIVEGHTYNVPVKGRDFKDNWDLSVIRATTVVRVLTREFGMSQNQVVPSGRGEFWPKASNETAGGRALNRRTEIIIAPHLDEVFKIIRENARAGQ